MNKPFDLKRLRASGYRNVVGFCELLEQDLNEHFNEPVVMVEDVVTEEERRRIDLIARVFSVIENHPARGFTYPEIAELAGVPRDYVGPRTWPTVLRQVGLCKLGKELNTVHGPSAVYCRISDAPELAVMDTVAISKELSPGLYLGRGKKYYAAKANPNQPTIGGVDLTF